MALIWDGNALTTLGGENRRGKDGRGNVVVVAATAEALHDYGWPTAWSVAESKYDRGEYEDNGTTRVVNVTTTDCMAEG